jgi:glycosyltransferase involved in cell wall biosynthesis
MVTSVVVLDRLPYPPLGGQQLRYRQAIEALRRLGPVMLLLLSRDAPVGEAAAGQPHAVHLDPEVPHGRLYRWARLLGPRGKKAWRARLRDHYRERLRASIAALLERTQPDLVVVENPELMACLPPLAAAGRRVVYDAHNVERLLWGELVPLRARLGAGSFNPGFRERILGGEAALVASADQIWACSEEDARLFPVAYPGRLPEIRVVPNAVDTEAFAIVAAERAGSVDGRAPVLLFTGNFGYAPNVEAARILLHELRPRLLASEPRLRIVLCGRQPPEELLTAAAADPTLTVTGEVPDARPWFARADAFVVPLRAGSGTRLKILEALAAACPVVSTPKGAEGLELAHGEHLLLAESEAELADAVRWCLRHREEALAMARRGRALVERLYSWHANAARVCEAVTSVPAASQGLPEPRSLRKC